RTIAPRLLYHRHFMLTEFLGNCPDDVRPLVERAIARNLCRETGAARVSLFRIFHDTASVADVLAGRSLNDHASFTEELLGSYTPQDLAAAYVASSGSPEIMPVETAPEATESPAEPEILIEIPPSPTELPR